MGEWGKVSLLWLILDEKLISSVGIWTAAFSCSPPEEPELTEQLSPELADCQLGLPSPALPGLHVKPGFKLDVKIVLLHHPPQPSHIDDARTPSAFPWV